MIQTLDFLLRAPTRIDIQNKLFVGLGKNWTRYSSVNHAVQKVIPESVALFMA